MTVTANQERGEFALELEGVDYVLRPSFEAILGFEGETGKGLLDLARATLGGNASLTEIAVIATHCIRAWGKENGNTNASGVNAGRVGALIMESREGLIGATTKIGALLAMAVNGGLNSKGEVKAATVTKSQKTGSASDAA